MHSHNINLYIKVDDKWVLILVVMEDALAPGLIQSKIFPDLVLILVVMEDALAPQSLLI